MHRISNALWLPGFLLWAFPLLALACPETLPDGVLCRRIAIASPVPKQVPQKVEVLYFSHLRCPACQSLSPLLPDWAKTLTPDIGLSSQHAHWGADTVKGQRELESGAPSSTLSRATDPQLFYTLKHLGVKNLGPLYLLASDAATKSSIWANSTNALGVRDETIRQTALSTDVQKAIQNGAEISKLAKLESVPAFLIDRRFVVELVHFGVTGHPTNVNRLNGLLTTAKEISQSVASASPQTRTMVSLFSDWESPAMDRRRTDCDRTAKLIGQNALGTAPMSQFESPGRYLECTLLGSPNTVLLAVKWQCSKEIDISKNDSMAALSAAKYCHWLAWHGQRSASYVLRTYGAAEAAKHAELIASLQAYAAKLGRDLASAVSEEASTSKFDKAYGELYLSLHRKQCALLAESLSSMSTKEAYGKFMTDISHLEPIKSCAIAGEDIFENTRNVIRSRSVQ